jgi:hypothetical protein
MSVVWACCSSGRSSSIAAKTLSALNDVGFIGNLLVCVPHAELPTYTKALEDYPVQVIGAEKGLVKQRKHIRSMFAEGQEIVFIDDDVTRIRVMYGRTIHPITNIHVTVDTLFQCLHNMEGPLMWGCYPMINRDWMKERMSIGNCYVVGAFYGIINDPRLVEPVIDECEDWARSLAEQKAGRAPVRFDWLGIDTRYFKNSGGMQQDRSPAKRRAAVEALVAQYSDIVKLKNRKGGHLDLKALKKPVYLEIGPLAQPPPTVTAAPAVSASPHTPEAAPVAPSPPPRPSCSAQ